MANEPVLNSRYRLISQQGAGGMAVIYKAVDEMLGRTVAVKVLRPSLTGEQAFLTRFRNEARSVANLMHPNIVTVHDVGSDGQTQYMVMEYVEGQDLKKIIRSTGALGVERTLRLAIQICHGIGYAHRAGLVHADVKPQNILVTKEDVVKVTDFGIAQAFSDTQPREKQSVVWGSPHYFSPEQAKGEKPTPASDVYAIGIVLFEMLTGQLPYSGANQQELALAHVRSEIPLITSIDPNIPENLANVIYKVMSKEPSARYRMADQLGRILEDIQKRGQQNTIDVVPPVQPPAPQPPQPVNTQPPPVVRPAPPAPIQPQGQQRVAPTSRINLAPEAPNPIGGTPRPPTIPQPPNNRPQPIHIPPAPGVSEPIGYTGRFNPQSRMTDEELSQGFDVVTFLLAGIAFVAVSGLIVLWIIVLINRIG
ncbi:MAG: serine/threonine protein kinase [Chloroflexi bacterium]|nr:MAG: hypothetical protein CUN54_00525 [Phototrophicales bacterium]RMF81798.1 MAG: serine/threonine protein kinase [Chloroflexota bacterium]